MTMAVLLSTVRCEGREASSCAISLRSDLLDQTGPTRGKYRTRLLICEVGFSYHPMIPSRDPRPLERNY